MNWIRQKKLSNFFGIGIIIFLYLVLLGLVTVPIVGLLTVQSIKMPDVFLLQEIQRKFYFASVRNIWQFDKNCASDDILAIYNPIAGQCNFNNLEFDTVISFDGDSRINGLGGALTSGDVVAVLGDSHAMGWGVNDNETFSAKLG